MKILPRDGSSVVPQEAGLFGIIQRLEGLQHVGGALLSADESVGASHLCLDLKKKNRRN